MSGERTWPTGATLQLDAVRVRRDGTEILGGINLRFEPEHRHVIIGASGSGKSTLIRLLNRLDDPDSGTITLGETPLSRWSVLEVRRRIGLVSQSPRPLPGTLGENLLYPRIVRQLPRLDRDGQLEALGEVGLDPAWLDRDAGQLSGGERSRLALAVVLGMHPEILILDEPTAALDPHSARRIADLLARKSQADHLRTIVVTHDRRIAPRLGDRGICLDRGLVVDEGPIHVVAARADRLEAAE